jgi:hypothetical protein
MKRRTRKQMNKHKFTVGDVITSQLRLSRHSQFLVISLNNNNGTTTARLLGNLGTFGNYVTFENDYLEENYAFVRSLSSLEFAIYENP